jgi:uncharacterized protein (DUF2336 family)
MITRIFLNRLHSADLRERIAVMAPLVRALVNSDLNQLARDEIRAALTGILDDPNPIIRRALAEALAGEDQAPRHLVSALASDQLAVAAPILYRSPVLSDSDLVELIGEGEERTQLLIASRPCVSASVSAALIEIAGARPCLELIENPGAKILPLTYARLAERHATHAPLRAAMLANPQVPIHVRQGLTLALCDALGELALFRGYVPPARGQRVLSALREQATIDLARQCDDFERRLLVGQLGESGYLTPALLLRALLCGSPSFFVDSIAFLSGVPTERAGRFVLGGNRTTQLALLEKAGIPETLFEGFITALNCSQRAALDGTDLDWPAARRQAIGEVLSAYHAAGGGELDEISAMLRRLGDEAARAEAKEVRLALTFSEAATDADFEDSVAA